MEIDVERLRQLCKEMDEILSGAKAELNDKYREFISSYVTENGSVLDEVKQKDLWKKLSKLTGSNIGLGKQLKEIGVSYGYIASNKSWKDIRIDL
ncbi:MAG: hypothetical protein E7D27_01865 [Clostridium celatum]|nr:hypothetical protein [Clostridium celatum]